jgi:hypothetical protein
LRSRAPPAKKIRISIRRFRALPDMLVLEATGRKEA